MCIYSGPRKYVKYYINCEIASMKQQMEEVLPSREYKPIWERIVMLTYFHFAAIYGIYLAFQAKVYTLLWALLVHEIAIIGVTAGAHRLFSHRSFKAKLPLKVMLTVFQTVAHQGPIIWWSHNHRVHHKYSDTDGDPHNPRRGVLFSHLTWFCYRYHPEVLEKKKVTDVSDLKNDPILAFQNKYFIILMPLLAFILPVAVPVHFWGEGWNVAYHINIVRFILGLHFTFLLNSWGHRFGNKPYDKNIKPGDNLLCSILTQGEGFHNYHHAFPWDYKGAEWGSYGGNFVTHFIDLMAKIGWAYDMKSASPELILRKMQNKGDGTHYIF